MKKWNKPLVLGVIAIISIVSIGLSIWVMNQYEYSLLTAYARQQDGYVKLALDQITVYDDRTDDEIVERILNSLGGSDTSYWTFAKDSSILYIKNVTETYQYKGITPSSYFTTESAQVFLSNIRENVVAHSIIELEGDRYVASGVSFTYNGANYRLCLLTDDTVILNENNFLSAKVTMYVVWITLIIIAVLSILIATISIDKREKEIEKQKSDIDALNETVAKLQDDLHFHKYYSPVNHAYSMEFYDTLVESLKERGAKYLIALHVAFEDREMKDSFLHRTADRLGDRVVRFDESETGALFLFVNVERTEAESELKRLLPRDLAVSSVEEILEN